jgi:hypothetical protein
MGKQAIIALETDRKKPIERDRSSSMPSPDGSATVLALIERIALDPCAGVEKLERIMAMYERLKAGETDFAFNAAKARILRKLVPSCIS